MTEGNKNGRSFSPLSYATTVILRNKSGQVNRKYGKMHTVRRLPQ